MTESLSSLRALSSRAVRAKQRRSASFADKWARQSAGHGQMVRGAGQHRIGRRDCSKLTQHSDFDLSNPNRVRSVIAVFAMQNLLRSTPQTARGIDWSPTSSLKLTRQIRRWRRVLLTSFEQWKSLEPRARGEAEAALKALQRKICPKTRRISSRAPLANPANLNRIVTVVNCS